MSILSCRQKSNSAHREKTGCALTGGNLVTPNRGTKAYNEETVEIYFGINPRTKRVQAVYRRRDNCLCTFNDDEQYIVHPIKPGWKGESEARLVFGLREIIAVPAALEGSEYTKKRIEELRAKAASWPSDTTS